MDLIKINHIELTGNKPRRVVIDFNFFDNTSKSVTIEFEKNHKYAAGLCDVVKIDETIMDFGYSSKNSISIEKHGNVYSDKKVNIILLDILKHGWKIIINNGKVYMKYKKSPLSLKWNTGNKDLRDFLIGLIAIAQNRGIISNENSFNNESELRAELWRLCKNATEKIKIKEMKFCIQYAIGSEYADFLIKKNRKPFVIIECKPKNYKNGIYQAKKYSKRMNVKYYGVCTEGKIVMLKPKKEFIFSQKGLEDFVKFMNKI